MPRTRCAADFRPPLRMRHGPGLLARRRPEGRTSGRDPASPRLFTADRPPTGEHGSAVLLTATERRERSMFSDEEIREAREAVADPNTSHRVRLANLRVLRAHAMGRLTAIDRRSNGRPTGNDAEAYQRVESELNDLDGQIARHERDAATDLADSPEYTRADDDAPGDEHRNVPRSTRRADVYLGERRFAEAFNIGRPAQRTAEGFSIGALLQGMAGVRELDPASAEGRALTGAGAGGCLLRARRRRVLDARRCARRLGGARCRCAGRRNACPLSHAPACGLASGSRMACGRRCGRRPNQSRPSLPPSCRRRRSRAASARAWNSWRTPPSRPPKVSAL